MTKPVYVKTQVKKKPKPKLTPHQRYKEFDWLLENHEDFIWDVERDWKKKGFTVEVSYDDSLPKTIIDELSRLVDEVQDCATVNLNRKRFIFYLWLEEGDQS